MTNPVNDILLIIDLNNSNQKGLRDSLVKLMGRGCAGSTIDVLAFSDLYGQELESQVKKISRCASVKSIDGSSYIDRTKESTRKNINTFVSGLREQLLSTAQEMIGKDWARRLGELWWYLFLTAKNTTALPLWWTIFHFQAVQLRITEVEYAVCLFVGTEGLADLLEQLCEKRNIRFKSTLLEVSKRSIACLALKRCLGFVGAFFMVLISLLTHGRKEHGSMSRLVSANKVVIYSYFPRVWTIRFGKWQDMYWGDIFEKLSSVEQVDPLYVLFVLDRWNFLLKYFVDRLRKLREKSARPPNFVLLESYGSLFRIIREYFNPKDIFNFRHVTRSKKFQKMFTCKGYTWHGLFSYHIWESIIVWWPSILVLKDCAERLARKIEPSLMLVTFFEYMDMRAVIYGTRLGYSSIIVGLQHGPITLYRMTNSGTIEDLKHTQSGGMPLPQPDLYAVDGFLARETLKKRGIGDERIKVIGPPRFDEVWKHSRTPSMKPRFQDGKVTLLVAPGLHDTETMLRFVLNTVHDDSRIKILVKLHPKVLSLNLDNMIHSGHDLGLLADVEIFGGGDIYKAMEHADIMLTSYSSTGVEAIAFGLPVVLLKSKRMPDLSPLSYDTSPVMTASTPETLREHIDLLVKDKVFRENYQKKLKDVVSRNFGPLDSNAANRFVALCLEQLKVPWVTRQN